MNKAQKQVTQAQLNREKQTIKELKQVYQQALKDCEKKISELSARTDMENLQSIIYQKQYQEAMKAQLEGVLSNLQSNSYATVSDYLTKCYRDGYTGVMYDLQQTGIPIIMPIDQAAVVRAIQTDSKLSKSLYDKMGEDVTYLKKAVRAEVSRGIANGSTWNEVAGKLSRHMANTPFQKAYNNSIRIARTEGHRIQVQSALDAQHVAKSKGADIVKQWDATLDGATREHHQMLDGQIREVDEPFEVANLKVEAPGMFGLASEDCNCRCCLLQRARWALDDEELQALKDRAAYFDLDKTDEFEEYQRKYLNLPENADTIDINSIDIVSNTTMLKSAMSISDYEEYTAMLMVHDNTDIQRLYANYADGISDIKIGTSGFYRPADNSLVFSYPRQSLIDNGKSKFSTLAHEYGHYFDTKAEYEGIHFKEVETIHSKTKYQMNRFEKVASSSDEFLSAVRKDRQFLKSILTEDVEKDLRDHDASSGVQDAIDGLLGHRICWGHGDKYYNRKYHSVKMLNEHRGLQSAYKELGIDASNLRKVATECRVYESASEMWANIMSAEINGGAELEYVKKYLPNSYRAMLDILREVK